jgi:hypothetical protein
MYTAVKSFYLTFYLTNIGKKCLRNKSTSVQETNQHISKIVGINYNISEGGIGRSLVVQMGNDRVGRVNPLDVVPTRIRDATPVGCERITLVQLEN